MDGFTRIEQALLDSLERERALLHQRDVVNGMVLHEIANAVTVVASGLELVKHSRAESPTHTFALQQIGRGVSVMSELIRGLRVLAESTGDPPVFARGDLPAFVQSVVTDPVLTAASAANRVRVVVRDHGTPALFCSTLLRHALSNLVRNALKYSPAQSPVTVIVSSRSHRRWIHVLNQGAKLSPAMRHSLFEPGRKNANGGMGFGLHITQACALRMGGRVVFGSTARSTVFSLLLPFEVSPVAPGIVPDINRYQPAAASCR